MTSVSVSFDWLTLDAVASSYSVDTAEHTAGPIRGDWPPPRADLVGARLCLVCFNLKTATSQVTTKMQKGSTNCLSDAV